MRKRGLFLFLFQVIVSQLTDSFVNQENNVHNLPRRQCRAVPSGIVRRLLLDSRLATVFLQALCCWLQRLRFRVLGTPKFHFKLPNSSEAL